VARNKSPAFQFYPKDYQADENVRLMSPAERGWYVDLMCFEWIEGSIPDDPDELARLVGAQPTQFRKAWERIGPCFKKKPRVEGRLIHPRLAHERNVQRKRREKLSSAGRKGAEKVWGNSAQGKKIDGHATERPMASDGSSSSSASSTAIKDRYTDHFEEFWSTYPRRLGGNPKKLAFKAWTARLREGINPADLITAAKVYARDCDRNGRIGTEFVMQAGTFLGPNERWKEYLEMAGQERERVQRQVEESKPLPEISKEERAGQLQAIREAKEKIGVPR